MTDRGGERRACVFHLLAAPYPLGVLISLYQDLLAGVNR
jgi:hypothetical protein